jgi:hypothetical protein
VSSRSLRTAAIALVALAMVGVIAVLSSTPVVDSTDPSSRSAGRGGTLALYTWLDRLGLPVHRVSGSFDLDGSDVLFTVQPGRAFSAGEQAALLDHLRGGGEAVLAVDPAGLSSAAGVLASVGVVPTGVTSDGTAFPAPPVLTPDRVRRVPLGPATLTLRTTGDGAGTVLDDGRGRTVAVMQPVGAGRVYVIGSPQPLSNEGLQPRLGDSWGLVLTVLEHARGGRIAFDEVHHGETGASGATGAIAWPVWLGGVLAGLVGLGYLALSGRRLGRPVAAGEAGAVPSATALVGAVAQLMERSRLRGAVADRYAEELKQRLSLATGIDPGLDDDVFVERLRGFRAGVADEAAEVLRRARALAAGAPSEAALVALAGRVDALERSLVAGAPAAGGSR